MLEPLERAVTHQFEFSEWHNHITEAIPSYSLSHFVDDIVGPHLLIYSSRHTDFNIRSINNEQVLSDSNLQSVRFNSYSFIVMVRHMVHYQQV
jgi:hypothetical protein